MSKIFKPRRGKASTMNGTKASTVLAAGEMFIEVPDTGVGTGICKMKMGDGVTAYSSLPYAMGGDIASSEVKGSITEDTSTTATAALANVTTGKTLGAIIGSLKKACQLNASSIATLNDDNNYRSAGWANSIYREKNLGSITSSNVGTFIANHIQGDTFIDIHPGDYVTIMDGTYNAVWLVAGLDPELNRGDTSLSTHHIGLIPRSTLFNAPMNSSNVTTGGYYGSAMRTSTLPTVATNLKNALGSRLLSRRVLLSNAVNNDAYSMAGANWKGSSSGWEWYSEYCTLMSEVQVYGSTVFSSSAYDIGEACSQLPYFRYVNHVKAGRSTFWLRAVASTANFAYASGDGNANLNSASSSYGVRPLIVIG